MQDNFHFSIVAKSYGLSISTVRRRARKLGIRGAFVTDDQAFDIANYGNSHTVELLYIHTDTHIIPSIGNFTKVNNLPDWPTN